jgi:hypothetical protein
LKKDTYGCQVLVDDCAVQWRADVSRCVGEVTKIFVVGFDDHVVRIEEVFNHCCRFGWVFAFGGTLEGHASVGISAAGDEMVEERDIAAGGYDVEML